MSTAAGQPKILVVMGVTGVGKTTVGKKLADALGWRFFDADDFHPETNVQKMARGVALMDADRKPWLEALHGLIRRCLREGTSAVLACSALKASYRHLLARGSEHVQFIHLVAPPEVIQARLKSRTGHFMNPDLLDSQFATLEEPPDALRVDASGTPDEIVDDILEALHVER